MIPRLRAALGPSEMIAALCWWREGVEEFEREFAHRFGARYGVSFSYGRTGLMAVLSALSIQRREILMPAYSCVVVAHAVVHSDNSPVFADISPEDFNMQPEQVSDRIGPKTGAVIATHMYGHPMDLGAIRRWREQRVQVIQDCALAPGASWQGTAVAQEGIAAIYSLNLGKPLCALSGGVVTTDDKDLYRGLLRFRESLSRRQRTGRSFSQLAYFAAQSAAFTQIGYRLTDRLARETPLLDRWLKYYDPEKIDLPADAQEPMSHLQGRIGLRQLDKLSWILERRRAIASRYHARLQNVEGLTLPPWQDGAVFSHYTIRVRERTQFQEMMRRAGVDTGRLFDYVIPDLPAYRNGSSGNYPHARQLAQEAVNLPNYPSLSPLDQERVIEAAIAAAQACR